MRISRLSKIKKHKVFRSFTWPNELAAFGQFNVIYGWNGTGKTTLSSLFECLQSGRPIIQGEVEFELDNGCKISGANIPNTTVPAVRVFNRDFIAKTIESIGQSNVAPIYFLGSDSIEQQKQVETLKTELETTRDSVTKADNGKRRAEKALDDFCVERAKLIKEALLGSPKHKNYDKRRFKLMASKLHKLLPPLSVLVGEEKERLRKKKELQAKPSITHVTISIPDVEQLHIKTSELLKQSVVSKVLDELVSDPKISSWVQQGLSLHKGDWETASCRFCGNEFPPERKEELEAHFNDAFATFQYDIEQAISSIDHQFLNLERVAFPDESRFYDHLASDVQPVVETVKRAITPIKQILSRLKESLDLKKVTPFKALLLEGGDIVINSDDSLLQASVDELNNLIDRHEETTNNLNAEIEQACNKLEQNYVLEALQKFDELTGLVNEATATLSSMKEKPAELANQIREIESEIIEHRRPAEELNQELRAYLGRDELQFNVKDTGYALTRGDLPAFQLSEGERTAIAFLYFLKSLQDKAFDMSKGIVVIDDPVSSLDANALFSAFGYMKERTKECHQLFILTHNFAFFRQVKNWVHHIKGQRKRDIALRPGRFYALLATIAEGKRNAVLSPIDPLLELFESEYHFLFKQVHEVANKVEPNTELADLYGLPNIARRLMETFLAYRFPDCGDDLIRRFERVDFDPAKKTKILRLLNTYSHSGGISDPEHDPSILTETHEVMKTILELMQALDSEHYQGMVKLLQPDEVEG